MNRFETDYRKLLLEVIREGALKDNRTGVKTITAFNKGFNINLSEGFPILTAKKVFFDKAYHEYVWIRDGLTTLNYLHEHGITWWDEFAMKDGSLGKTYGYQLRNYNGEIDQLDYIHRQIRGNSRRAHITLWNPSDLNKTILPPCYTGFTFMRVNEVLHMSVQFRSSDLFLGLPYDICVCALLLIEVAKFNDLIPGELGLQITDAHLYENHIDQVTEYLQRKPESFLPTLLKSEKGYNLSGYKPQPFIWAQLNN